MDPITGSRNTLLQDKDERNQNLSINTQTSPSTDSPTLSKLQLHQFSTLNRFHLHGEPPSTPLPLSIPIPTNPRTSLLSPLSNDEKTLTLHPLLRP